MPVRPGTFVAVVGPSGVGKDSLLRYARQRYDGDPRVSFPRRHITRPGGDGAEDHLPTTPEAFSAAERNGDFALCWEAHGLHYGIPATIDAELQRGLTLVVNVSRARVEHVRRRYASVRIVSISVAPERLRERLTRRGRENPAEVERRLSRIGLAVPRGTDVIGIDNSGALEGAGERLCAVISDTLS